MECCSVPGIGGISLEIAEDTAEEDIVRGCRTLATATESLLHQVTPVWRGRPAAAFSLDTPDEFPY